MHIHIHVQLYIMRIISICVQCTHTSLSLFQFLGCPSYGDLDIPLNHTTSSQTTHEKQR